MNNLSVLPSSNKATIGQRIRFARKTAHLSRLQFAMNMGVSNTAVGYWENDHKRPSDANIRRIAQVTGSTYEYLILGTGEQLEKTARDPLKDFILSLDATKDLPASVLQMLQQMAKQ